MVELRYLNFYREKSKSIIVIKKIRTGSFVRIFHFIVGVCRIAKVHSNEAISGIIWIGKREYV